MTTCPNHLMVVAARFGQDCACQSSCDEASGLQMEFDTRNNGHVAL